MATIIEYDAICCETGQNITFSVQKIKNALGNIAQEFTCNYSNKCTKCNCFYNGGTEKYRIITNKKGGRK